MRAPRRSTPVWRRALLPVVGVALVLLLLALRIADPFPVQVAREIGFDVFQRLAPRPVADLPVRVVDIDEASLASLGQWPWPRDRLAQLTDRLAELGAAVIAFDMLFAEPDRMSPRRIAAELPGIDPATLPDHDARFAEALATTPSVLGLALARAGAGARPLPPSGPKGGFAISGADPRAGLPLLAPATVPLPALGDAAAGLGVLSLDSSSAAAAVRKLPLLWTDGTAIYPTLSLEALRLALGISGIVVLADPAAEGYVEAVRLGDFTIPTTSSGDLWLHYSRPRPDVSLSARDLLGGDYRRFADRIEGHIVLIGTSAAGLLDLHYTTLGDNLPGVEIHAQAIEQILSSSYLTRPDWVQGLEWLVFLAFGLTLVAVVLWLGPVAGLLAGALALGLSVALSWWMFRSSGHLLDPSFPLIGLTLLYLGLVFLRFLTTDAARRQIRRAFGYYVAPSLLDEIERNGDRLKLGGETRRITVMFTDLRGFTALGEQLPPQRLLGVLNTLFGALGAEIVGRLGTIDKFIGDAIMAFWNAPVDVADHERRALEAALGMRARLAALNAADAFGLVAEGRSPTRLGIGIGIAAGEAVVGNMGLETRFDYSALGDTVNIASRIESACPVIGYDILVAPALAEAAPDFACLAAGSIALKGKSERLSLFLLVGPPALAATSAFSLLRLSHTELLALMARGADITGALAECRALARQVEPGLESFYVRLSDRAADFAGAHAAA